MIDLSIRNLQKVQQANIRRIAMLQPQGALGQLIRNVTAYTHRQAIAVTHADTGALRASHLMEVTAVRGRVYINPGAVNPRSGAQVAEYAEDEHNRGGEHAFYKRATAASAVYFRNTVKQLEREIAR